MALQCAYTDMSRDQTTRATTVFDRTLLRAGETVSIHLMREETLTGFAFPSHLLSRVTIRHEGSGQTYHLPLKWAADRSADSTFPIPAAAKLGEYSVTLDDGSTNSDDDSDNNDNSGGDQNSVRHMSIKTGSFRVEKFRLPVFKGSIGLRDQKTGALLRSRLNMCRVDRRRICRCKCQR